MITMNMEISEETQELFDWAFNVTSSCRTDTELRVMVLENKKFPTAASKYYKALAEVKNLYVQIKNLVFEHNLRKLEMLPEEDPKQLVENEKTEFLLFNLDKEVKDRLNEVELWKTIIKELEPVLIESDLPLDNPDAYQKSFLLIKNIRLYIDSLSKEDVDKNELSSILNSIKINAEIIKEQDLTTSVIKELSLGEKDFVSRNSILDVGFTDKEQELISNARKLQTPENDKQDELEVIKSQLDKLMKQSN